MPSTDNFRRVAIFCERYHHASSVEHIEAIADAFPHWEFTVIQEITGRPGPLPRWVWDTISYPMRYWTVLVGRLGWPRRRGDGPAPLAGSPAGIERTNVRYIQVPGLYHEATLRLVEEQGSWLGISIDAPTLKRPLFGIPQLGTINIHKSLPPTYRGTLLSSWQPDDRATAPGVIVHWMDDGLDTWRVIQHRSLAVSPYSTLAGLAVQLDLLGTDVLIEALHRIDSGTDSHPEQKAKVTLANRYPPRCLERALRPRASCRRNPGGGPRRWFVELGKSAVLRLYVEIYCRLRNALRGLAGRCHATVLVYHRVSDEFLDTVTVGINQFEQHLRCLKRHYDVVDLPTFLTNRGTPRHRPCVVLTFDDGYEDNLLAALLLRRAGLPCTFFISTRIVGTDRAFPHDLHRLGRRVPALGWNQVRRMASWGFRMGNHTANHANLGTLSAERAVAEVVSAREDLRRELGDRACLDWLAYPYGKSKDITDEIRSLLPTLGIPYCFAAYGGTNTVDFDPLNILRQGVDHRFTALRLRAAVEGWNWRR